MVVLFGPFESDSFAGVSGGEQKVGIFPNQISYI